MIININNPPLHVVEISRQGENEFREIVIDVSAWLAEYPDGKISVIYCRPDGELYPVIVNATESPITWRPTATDTAVSGVGAIEVRIQIGDVLGKSCTIEANVLGALGAPGGTPAAPAPDWAQTATEDADRAEAAAEKAEAASTHVPQISENKTWLVWDAEAGEYVDTGVSAAGEKGDDGDPGKAPIIGADGNWYEWDDAAGAYTDTGKPSRGEKGETGSAGADGADGRDGSDGITPTIGENGNWYLGAMDTGKPSRGKDGATGATGEKGADGKSAYQYAQDGGYTGTEEEFAAKMAEEMPDALPNPNALTFTGAVEGSYDGSAPLSVNIPSGGGGALAGLAIADNYDIELISHVIIDQDNIPTAGITVTQKDDGSPFAYDGLLIWTDAKSGASYTTFNFNGYTNYAIDMLHGNGSSLSMYITDGTTMSIITDRIRNIIKQSYADTGNLFYPDAVFQRVPEKFTSFKIGANGIASVKFYKAWGLTRK